MPGGSKISHKNTKIHKITHKYTHTHNKTIKKTLKEQGISHCLESGHPVINGWFSKNMVFKISKKNYCTKCTGYPACHYPHGVSMQVCCTCCHYYAHNGRKGEIDRQGHTMSAECGGYTACYVSNVWIIIISVVTAALNCSKACYILLLLCLSFA